MKKSIAIIVAAAFSVAGMARAAALTAARDTPSRSGEVLTLAQGSNTVYAGAIVCVDSSGAAAPGADASGYAMAGRAEATSDNSGSAYDASTTVDVRRGVFRWANGSSFTDANIGDFAYIGDDQTVVAATGTTYGIVAGLIVDVDSSGVWIDCLAAGGQGAGSFATLASSGTLTVTGATTLNGTTYLGTTLQSGDATFSGTSGAKMYDLTLAGTGTGTLSVIEIGSGTNALVMIAGGVTNVLDADLATE